MKKWIVCLLVIACVVGLAIFACLWFPNTLSDNDVSDMLEEEGAGSFVADLERGGRLFNIGGCTSCHQNGEENGMPVLGGYQHEGMGKQLALHSSVGSFHPSNISSSKENGIGDWTDGEFVTAMKLGVSPNGRHYYPSFPYTAYAKATTEDLLHLKAYLMSLPASENEVPAHEMRFPFSVRLGNGAWKALFHDTSTFQPDHSQSETWNWGAYVVNGLGHCSTCHTPRTIAMREDRNRHLWGAPKLEEGQKDAPALAGISTVSLEGAFDEWSPAFKETSVMNKVSVNILKLGSDEPSTIAAMAEYLSSLPAPEN